MVGLDKPLARKVLPQCKDEGLTWGAQTFGKRLVRLKAWHGGARQTFGPNFQV